MTPLRVAALAFVGVVLLLAAYVLVNDEGGPLLPGGTLLPDEPRETAFRLEQNQPNPFQETTAIIYSIPAEERVTLQVYNTLGAPVVTLVDRVEPPGFHQVEWDGKDRNGNRLPGGIYFYQLTAAGRQELRRMVLLP